MSWGFSALLAKKGMDIVLLLTLERLSANYQPIHLSESKNIFLLLSLFLTLTLSIFISQTLALHQTPSPLFSFTLIFTHSLTPLLSSFPHVCSPSIIFSTPFPERRHARYGDKKVMIKARLCWKSFLPVSKIQSISFLFG